MPQAKKLLYWLILLAAVCYSFYLNVKNWNAPEDADVIDLEGAIQEKGAGR